MEKTTFIHDFTQQKKTGRKTIKLPFFVVAFHVVGGYMAEEKKEKKLLHSSPQGNSGHNRRVVKGAREKKGFPGRNSASATAA